MSIYRMLRKSIEFDLDRLFREKAQGGDDTNLSGLIDVMKEAVEKFSFMTAEESDFVEIARERAALAQAAGERALDFIVDDAGDFAYSSIKRATIDLVAGASRATASG